MLESDCATTQFSGCGLRRGASETNGVNSHAGEEGEAACICCSSSRGFSTTNEKVAPINAKLYECKGKKKKNCKRFKRKKW